MNDSRDSDNPYGMLDVLGEISPTSEEDRAEIREEIDRLDRLAWDETENQMQMLDKLEDAASN